MTQSDSSLLVLTGTEQQTITLSMPMLEQAAPILDQMDRDMDKGWQSGRYFLANPNTMQRCQIVANRLLTALHTDNQALSSLMTAFIMTRLANVAAVNINLEGEVDETCFYDHENRLILTD